MKKQIKKVLCVILALVMASSLSVFAMAAEQEEYPTVFIHGFGPEIISEDGETLYPVSVDVNALVKDNIQPLLESIVLGEITGDWSDCSELLLSIATGLFEPLFFNSDGEPINKALSLNNLDALSKNKSGYGLYDYTFRYDWREDPVKISKQLNEYIKAVLAATEKEKVNIVAFSMGGCSTLAYLAQFGNEDVDTVVFHSSAHNGVVACGSPMAGGIEFNAQSVERYLNYYLKNNSLFGDKNLDELFGALLVLLGKVNTFGFASAVLDRFYENCAETLIPNLGLVTVGSFPGIWSFITEEYYEDAKTIAFSDKGDKYDKFIEIIDYYHNNIQLNSQSILQNAMAKGTKICVLAKYGIPQLPLYEGSNIQSDGIIVLKDQSLGATCADMDSVLSNEYIEKIKAEGKGEYLSPDKSVDASTCFLPDSTWFLKGVEHSVGGEFADSIIEKLINKPAQPKVSDEDTPERFNLANKATGKLEPITEETAKTESFFSAAFRFITSLFKYLFSLIKK